MIKRDVRGGLFVDMGLGKTVISLYLARHQGYVRVGVVAPLYCCMDVWGEELKTIWPDATVIDCSQGSLKKRAQRLIDAPKEGVVFAVFGYETYWREPLRSAILKWAPDLFVADECSKLARRQSRQSRFAHILGDKVPHRLGLSGTPMPGGIEGLWSQFRFIDSSVFGTRWIDFQSRYLKMGGYGGHEIKGYQNEDELERKLHEACFRITEDEAGLQLPRVTDHKIIRVQLTPASRERYAEMEKEAIIEIEGTDEDGQPIQGTALSRVVLTNLVRCQQLTSGFIKLEDGQIATVSSEKLDALENLLADTVYPAGRKTARKTVVFCRFKSDVRRVSELCAKYAETAFLDGTVKDRERAVIKERFTETKDDMIIVAQIAVTAFGVNWITAASVGIFYSRSHSLIDYLQARKRLHRPGQKRPVHFYQLVVEDSGDMDIYDSLAAKQNIATRFLDKSSYRRLFGHSKSP